MADRIALPVTIANGTSVSGAVDLLGYDFIAVALPAAWTAADLTFQTSADNVQYRNVYDGAATPAEITVGADADLWVQIPDTIFRQFGRFVRIRSGTSALAVNQGAERTLYVIGRC